MKTLSPLSLLFTFALACTSPQISHAVTEGDKVGGGGDAIMIEDEIILRDFLMASTFETVLDNSTFLKSIPDFEDLIHEISVANGELALMIVVDLMKTNIFKSFSPLPTLATNLTAMNGPVAEVQLAIRIKNDIVLAPEFEQLKSAAYLMVHEALHGLLRNSEGAFHHHRVRNIVKYLKDNRGNYHSRDLAILLEKNRYQKKFTVIQDVAESLFVKNKPEILDCAYSGYFEEVQLRNYYFGNNAYIKCPKGDDLFTKKLEAYFNEHIFSIPLPEEQVGDFHKLFYPRNYLHKRSEDYALPFRNETTSENEMMYFSNPEELFLRLPRKVTRRNSKKALESCKKNSELLQIFSKSLEAAQFYSSKMKEIKSALEPESSLRPEIKPILRGHLYYSPIDISLYDPFILVLEENKKNCQRLFPSEI